MGKEASAHDKYLCQIHLGKGVIRTVELHEPNHGVLDHKIPEARRH